MQEYILSFVVICVVIGGLYIASRKYYSNRSITIPAQPAQPAQQFAEPAQQSTQFVQPAQQFVQQFAEPAQQFMQPAQPTPQSAQPAPQSVQPTQQSTQFMQPAQPAQLVQQFVQPTQQSAQQFAEPVQLAQPTQQSVQLVQQLAESAQQPVQQPAELTFAEELKLLKDKYNILLAIQGTNNYDVELSSIIATLNNKYTYISILESIAINKDKKNLQQKYTIDENNVPIFSEIYNFIYITIGHINQYKIDRDDSAFKENIEKLLDYIIEFAHDFYLFINKYTITYVDNLHIILLHQAIRFIQLIYVKTIYTDTNIIIPGDNNRKLHALGIGIANTGNQRSILSIRNLTFLCDILNMLDNDTGHVKYGAIGVIAPGKLVRVDKDENLPYTVQIPNVRGTGIYHCAPGADCIHLWGANVDNWKVDVGKAILGSGQVTSLPVQGPGIFGIITMPDYDIVKNDRLLEYINKYYNISLDDTLRIHINGN